VHLTQKWMLINRIIQPLVWQPYLLASVLCFCCFCSAVNLYAM
jgi:hypothetical protein